MLPELLQDQMTTSNIMHQLSQIMQPDVHASIVNQLRRINQVLNEPVPPIDSIVSCIQQQST